MTIAFVLLGLIVVTWLYTSYLSYKVSTGKTFEPIERSHFIARWTQALRLIRRGWYSVNMEGKHLLLWSGKRAENAFVAVFPKSADAFAKKDELTGLQTGPTSYFLKSISKPKQAPQRRLPKTKKVV